MEIIRAARILGVGVVLTLGILSASATAQTVGGTIRGKVKDQTGAVLPGADVTIRNTATAISRAILTNETGAYSAANLQPGKYDVTVEMPAFGVGVRKDINLNVGDELAIDFDLKLEGSSETVEVTARESRVDLVASTINRTVEGTTIRELPLNGRDWTQLAILEPGIAPIGKGGSGQRDGNGVKLTVSGARPSENNFRLDGISLNDNSNSTPGSILGTNLGVEAVREFSVVSNSYSAEYGRATGAVVNAVTKSGTNDIHGSLFYFHRNSALDARNYFDGATKPSFRRHQFGAAAGGPIVKNRTFWFGNYESVREFLATTSISNVLSANARQGVLSTGTVTVDSQIASLFPLIPLPNGSLLSGGDVGEFSAQRNTLSKGQYFLGKIDHTFSSSNSLTGSYFFDDANANSPDALLTKRTADKSRRQMFALEHTRIINPRLLNVARFGFSRSTNVSGVITQVLNPLLDDKSLGFIPGLNIGSTAVAGISVPGSGPGATNITELYFNSFQGHENLYITSGAHSIKIGGSFERMQYNMDIPNLNGGQYSFGSIPEFLTNRPSTFGALYPGSDTRRGLRQSLIAGYIQDDVRVRNNLSFNAGVRYEFLTIPTEVNGKVALLRNLTDSQVKVGGPVLDRNPTRRNFSPRVGFVWDPFSTGKTSVRAGFGVFDSLPLIWLFDTPLTRSLPFFLQGVSTAPPAGSFPKGAFPLLQVQNLRTAYIEPAPARAYSMKWNFNIQREVRGWVADIGYTGSRGVHLPLVERNMNTVIPVRTTEGRWIYPAGAQKLNPNFSSINTTDTWNADSYYHGLQTSLKRTWGQGIHVQSSYSWSKSIDTASSTGSTTSTSGYSGSTANVHPLVPVINRGLSDFDIRHNFSFSMVWQIPLGGGWLFKGWQLGSIYRAQTGLPFSVVLNNDRGGSQADTTGNQLGQRPDRILSAGCKTLTNPGNPDHYVKTECLSFPAKGTLGNLARNTLTKPGVSNFDFSILKNFKHSETTTVQFRAEFFNALNHTNFGTPNITVFDSQGRVPSAAGRITSTGTDPRRIQFGLKVNF